MKGRLSNARAHRAVDDLADLEFLGDLAGVGSLNLANSDASGVGNLAEGITRLDGVVLVGARAARADGNVGLVAGEDLVEAGKPALVGILEGLEGNVEVVGDKGEGVPGEDLVLGWADGETPNTGAVAVLRDLLRKTAGLVGGLCAVAWDDEELIGVDEVGVGDVVVLGNVARASGVGVRNASQSVTSLNIVGRGIPRAARKLSIRTLAL